MVPNKVFDSRSSSKGAPVLVWIDGGGFSAGYKHEQPPAGLITRSQSVDEEGIIYVAMNYRVGLFVSISLELLLLLNPGYRLIMVS